MLLALLSSVYTRKQSEDARRVKDEALAAVPDKSMVAHWANLLERELDAALRAKLPEIQQTVEALERARKPRASLLDERVSAAPDSPVTPEPQQENQVDDFEKELTALDNALRCIAGSQP